MVVYPCYRCLPPIAAFHANCTPPSRVREEFDEVTGGKESMNASDLAEFMRSVQGEKDFTEEDAEKQMAELSMATQSSNNSHYNNLKLRGLTHSSKQNLALEPPIRRLDLPTFLKFLLNPNLNGPISPASQTITQDMRAPLSHYYIFASHNSYLTGNQLTSECSTAPIVEALLNGCRVIELDCWERHGKIKVLHGNTLTKSVGFENCIKAIKENAFKTSNYPVIITIENHLKPNLQKQAASVLKGILGDTMFIPTAEDRPPLMFQSPEDLKGRIIISDKPPSEPVGKQIAEEPRALSSVVKGALMGGDSDTDSLEGEENSNKGGFGRNAQQRVMEKVAHKMASVESGDRDNEVIHKIHEFEELLYIYCAKPSEMEERHVKGGPLLAGERALMANLSEPQLGDLIKKHPNSLIEFAKSNLGRVYPFGLRFDSSNADPMVAWTHGIQVAAINMQGCDRAVWVAKAFFGLNGGCGYVKTPDFLLPGSDMDIKKIESLEPKLRLKVRVFLGTDWHRNYDLLKKPDYYVKVAIHGVLRDQVKKRTKVKYRSREPHWEEEFEFSIRVPELAVLRLEVREHDKFARDDMVGQACMPVTLLWQGIRAVALQSKKGAPRRSKLLCHFELQSMFDCERNWEGLYDHLKRENCPHFNLLDRLHPNSNSEASNDSIVICKR